MIQKPTSEAMYGSFISLTDYKIENGVVVPYIDILQQQLDETKKHLGLWLSKMGKNAVFKWGDPDFYENKNKDPLSLGVLIGWKIKLTGRSFAIEKLKAWAKPKPKMHTNKKRVPKNKRGKPIYGI